MYPHLTLHSPGVFKTNPVGHPFSPTSELFQVFQGEIFFNLTHTCWKGTGGEKGDSIPAPNHHEEIESIYPLTFNSNSSQSTFQNANILQLEPD